MALHKKHGRRYWGGNRLTAFLNLCHPVVCFGYLCGVFFFIFLYNHPLFVAASFLLTILQAAYLLGGRHLFFKMRAGFLFCALAALLNPLLNHRGAHVICYLFNKPITWEAVAYSGYFFLLLSTLLILFLLLNAIMGVGKILYISSRVIPQTGFIIGMSLRYSGLFKRQATDYLAVQNSREMGKRHAGIFSRIQWVGNVLSGFTVLVLENGLQSAEHLRAKEYGSGKRTLYLAYPITVGDILFVAASLLLVVASVIFYQTGAGRFDYFSNLAGYRLNSGGIAAFCILITYHLLPFGMDAIQKVKGKFNI